MRIARRKMHADIAVGERAEDRVDQRMQRHVGVGMAGELARRAGSARRRARRDRRRSKACTSKPMPVRISASAVCASRSARAKSSGVVIFMLPLSPSKTVTLHARPFGERGVVGEIVAASRRGARGAHRAAAGKAKACGVCTVRSAARSSVAATRPSPSTSLTVSVTGRPGTAAPLFRGRRDRAADQRGRRERPRRIVHQHDRRARRAASASSPARTEPCRVAPPMTGGGKRRVLRRRRQSGRCRRDG